MLGVEVLAWREVGLLSAGLELVEEAVDNQRYYTQIRRDCVCARPRFAKEDLFWRWGIFNLSGSNDTRDERLWLGRLGLQHEEESEQSVVLHTQRGFRTSWKSSRLRRSVGTRS